MIRVIASRPLHGKARLVLVEAKGRELLVAVHEGRTDLLGGWSSDDADAPMLSAEALMEASTAATGPRDPAATVASMAPKPAAKEPAAKEPATHSSPAVAGILKLRQKAEAAIHPDAEWARELALATANKRSAS